LPSSHGNTGTAIHIDNPPAIQDGLTSGDTAALIQSFAARLTKTEDTLTEIKTDLAETRAELHLVNTKVEPLEAQIIALHGDRTYVAIQSLFDVADIPLDAWAQSLGNVEAHQCSISEYVSILADGSWKMALNMAPQKFTTAEGIEQLERQCRDIMTAGFRLDWPHLVRWAGKFFRPLVCNVTVI
jgi:hypothetical protein